MESLEMVETMKQNYREYLKRKASKTAYQTRM